MIVPITRSSLIKPLTDKAVLVPNESIYYAERQHWASIAQPVYETFVFLLVVIWIVGLMGNGNPSGGFSRGIGIILLLVAIQAALMAVNGRNPISRFAVDPFAHPNKGPNRVVRAALAALFVLILVQLGVQGGGIVAVIFVIGRLIVILAQWAFYERRYITNRRLIESGGFLGSRINSMPLSRVTDISFSRSVPAEIFGYARMRIETAGQEQALGVVRFIAEPDHFYEVLVNFSAPQSPAANGA
jgi:membrane protein YdbS with pleckstrin-like domain